MSGQDCLQHGDGPALQGLGQNGVVGVGARPVHQLERLVPRQTLKVNEDTHQLRDGQRGMGVIQLNGNLQSREQGDIALPILYTLKNTKIFKISIIVVIH